VPEPEGGTFEGMFYDGDFDQIPDIDGLGEPSFIVETDVLDLDTAKFEEMGLHDHFAARWTGEVEVHTGGTYTFFVRSDDGSKIYVNHVLVVDNDGLHGPEEEKSGTVDLEEGEHPITVDFFEKDGSANLHVEYVGPDTDGRKEPLHSTLEPLPHPTGPRPSELLLNMYCKQYLDEESKENPSSSKLKTKLNKCRGQDCQQAEEDVGCHYMTPEGFCYIDSGQHWCAENSDSPWCITDVEPLYEICEGHGVMAAWEAGAETKSAAKSSLRIGGRGRGRDSSSSTHAGRTAVQSRLTSKAREKLVAASRKARRDSVAHSVALQKIRKDLKDIHVTEEVAKSELGERPKTERVVHARKGSSDKSWKSIMDFLE